MQPSCARDPVAHTIDDVRGAGMTRDGEDLGLVAQQDGQGETDQSTHPRASGRSSSSNSFQVGLPGRVIAIADPKVARHLCPACLADNELLSTGPGHPAYRPIQPPGRRNLQNPARDRHRFRRRSRRWALVDTKMAAATTLRGLRRAALSSSSPADHLHPPRTLAARNARSAEGAESTITFMGQHGTLLEGATFIICRW